MYRAHDIFCAATGGDDELKTEMMLDEMRDEGLVDDYGRPTEKALRAMDPLFDDDFDPEWEAFMEAQREHEAFCD